MGLTITTVQKKPLAGVAGRYGVEDDASVRGLRVSISEPALYASLTDGLWRYWVRREDASSAETFGGRVGRLLPVQPAEFMALLNDQATGAIQPSSRESPRGAAIVFDLPDVAVVERFALACAVGESLSQSERVLFSRAGQRGSAAVLQDALPTLNVNVSLWAVVAPGLAVVFLPNAVFLRRGRHQWVVPYAEVDVRIDARVGPEAWTELCLALSDQRVRVQVSDPRCARRAVRALERLIAFEANRRAHLGSKPSHESSGSLPALRGETPINARTSCGRIVIKPKQESGAEDPIVVRVKLGAEAEPPGPDPDQGLSTPLGGAEQEELIFCDASGLVFATESPTAKSSPPETRSPAKIDSWARPSIDPLRSAVGVFLAYVAKASDGFTADEQRLIRQILQLPAGFPLEQRYSGVEPASRSLELAASLLRERSLETRRRVLRDCEGIANADRVVTRRERQRLAELRMALDL